MGALRLHPLPQLPQQRTLLPPLPLLHQLLLQLALRPHPPPQQRALLPLAGIFVIATSVVIYMVGAQKPLAGIFVAAAVVLYMVGAQKPPEIGNTINKVIISSYHHIFVVVDFLYISNNMSRYHPMR